MSDSEILESKTDVLQVAALPGEQSEIVYHQVLKKALGAYKDADSSEHALVEDVDEFGQYCLLNHPSNQSVKDQEDLRIYDPLMVMVRSAIAAIVMENHERVEDIPGKYIKLLDYVAEEYARHILGILRSGENLGFNREWIDQLIGYQLYASSAPEKETHPGVVVKQITTLEDKPGRWVEIPLVSASPKALVRAANNSWGGSFDSTTQTVDGQLYSFIRDNNLYVPFRHMNWKHHQRLSENIRQFFDFVRQEMTQDELEFYLEHTPKIEEEIHSFFERGHEDKVVTGWGEDEKLIRVLTGVLQDSDLKSTAPHSANLLYNLLQQYNLDGWQQAVVNEVSSPKQLAKKLSNLAISDQGPPVEAIETDEGNRNEYVLGTVGSKAKSLPVDEINDLFELPCFNNLDERLKKKGPTRWELYSFVRTVSWLPEYYEADFPQVLEDLQDTFERWPWHDRQETEYQVRYELTGSNNLGLGGGESEVLPLNCNNERWQSNYCIGTDECPYHTMYSALPFHESLYSRLDELDHQGR